MIRNLLAFAAFIIPAYVMAENKPVQLQNYNNLGMRMGQENIKVVGSDHNYDNNKKHKGWENGKGHSKNIGKGHSRHQHAVPEIDGAQIILALGLFAGILSLTKKR